MRGKPRLILSWLGKPAAAKNVVRQEKMGDFSGANRVNFFEPS